MIDGEAVLLGIDGISDFTALHSRKHDEQVQLYAFDILAFDGEDLRALSPLIQRLSPSNPDRSMCRRCCIQLQCTGQGERPSSMSSVTCA